MRHLTRKARFNIDVKFNRDDGYIAVECGNKHFETNLMPGYLRYLYILAWADYFPAFHVRVELTML
jgi:hypothetical protein